MKSRRQLSSSAKLLLTLALSLSTLYGRSESANRNRHSKAYHKPRVNRSAEQDYNVRDPTNVRITDKWFEKWGPYIKNGEDVPEDVPEEAEETRSSHDIANYAGFGISKPKPWRKDDPLSRTRNTNAEVQVDPAKPKKMPLPEVAERAISAAAKMLSPEGCGKTVNKKARIVNGKNAEEGAYPWMAALLKGGDPWCGGAIINERWILTAGHCFMNDISPKLYAIRVGTIDRNRGPTYKVDKVLVHERFHLDNMFNSDIALLHVNRDIKMNRLVTPICISKKHYEEPQTSKLLVTGWGQTSYENKELPTYLQEVVLDMITVKDCAKRYKKKQGSKIYYSQICSWNKGQDACQGDSGAPAIEYRDDVAYLIGIVSYGSTCADDMPGVYTKVSYFYDWIVRTLAQASGLTDGESEADTSDDE